MPEFSMWGPEQSGTRLAQQDSIKNFVAIATGQHQQALAEQESFKALQAKKQMEVLSSLSTADRTGGPANGGTVSDIYDEMADKFMRAGLGDAAAKASQTGAELRLKGSQTRAATALASERELKARTDSVDTVYNLLGSVKSQADYDRARILLANSPQGADPNIQRILQLPYDPGTIDLVGRSLLKIKDKLHADHENQMARIAAADQASKAAYRSNQVDIGRQKANAYDVRADAYSKHLGTLDSRDPAAKAVGMPGPKEVDAAKVEVMKAYPDLEEKDAGIFARVVAENTRRLMKDIPSLTPDQARQRAIAQENDSISKEAGMTRWSKTKTHFDSRGRTAQTALPIPSGSTSFQDGKWYQTPKGPMRWSASGKSAPPSQPSFRDEPPPPDDSEDEE